MGKAEFVRCMAQQAGITQKQAALAFDALTDAVIQSVRQDGYAKLQDLCSFTVVTRAPRLGRNPKTGAAVGIAARRAVKLKAMKALKDAI